MVGYANETALRRTIESGRATFWSRSRQELWEKGKTSGHVIHVSRLLIDCDGDCVVYSSEPEGSSCHTGAESCFFREYAGLVGSASSAAPLRGPEETSHRPAGSGTWPWVPVRAAQALLPTLERILESRKAATSNASYTKSLYAAGPPKIGAKIVEEAGELAAAIASETDDRVVSEAADVLYHVMVGLGFRGLPMRRVLGELARRFGKSGHEEKASR